MGITSGEDVGCNDASAKGTALSRGVGTIAGMFVGAAGAACAACAACAAACAACALGGGNFAWAGAVIIAIFAWGFGCGTAFVRACGGAGACAWDASRAPI